MTTHDDELPPMTPEEEKAFERLEKIHQRFPTFVLLGKLLNSHSRLKRLRELEAPKQIIENEIEIRAKHLERVAQAFPSDKDGFHIIDIIQTLDHELHTEPEKRRKIDA
jgi:hypothetical protein